VSDVAHATHHDEYQRDGKRFQFQEVFATEEPIEFVRACPEQDRESGSFLLGQGYCRAKERYGGPLGEE